MADARTAQEIVIELRALADSLPFPVIDRPEFRRASYEPPCVRQPRTFVDSDSSMQAVGRFLMERGTVELLGAEQTQALFLEIHWCCYQIRKLAGRRSRSPEEARQDLVRARTLFSQDNVASLSKTLAHLEQTTSALADKQQGMNAALANFSKASAEANRAFAEMNKLMQSSDKLANGELKQSLARANAAMASFESSMGTLDALVKDNRGAIDSGARGVAQLGPTMTELRGTLSSVQGVVRELDNDPAGYLLSREPMKEFKP